MSQEQANQNQAVAQHSTGSVSSSTQAKASLDPAQVSNHIGTLLAALQLDERLALLEQQTRENQKKQPVSPSAGGFSGHLLWYIAGFGLIGFSAGLFAGWSSSPVVSTLLPMLFGLLGGASGLFLAQSDLEAFRVRALGVAIIGFSALCILGCCVGVSMRTGAGIWDFRPRWVGTSEPPILIGDAGERNPELHLQLLALRVRLKALGATHEEQVAILADTARILGRAHTSTVDFSKTTDALVKAADSLHQVASRTQDMNVRKKLEADRGYLLDGTSEIKSWGQGPVSAFLRNRIEDRLGDFNQAMKNIIFEVENTLAPNEKQAAADLREAQEEILAAQNHFATAFSPTVANDLRRQIDAISMAALNPPSIPGSGRAPASVPPAPAIPPSAADTTP